METTSKNGTSIVGYETETLRDRHEALNCTKKGRGVKPDSGQTLSEAKQEKMRIKYELIERAKAGDQIATAYAVKRRWPDFISPGQLVEAG